MIDQFDSEDTDDPTRELDARASVDNAKPARRSRTLADAAQVASGDGEVHFLDYVKVLYKRRWMALSVFLVIVVSVTVYAFTATPQYEATVKLLIEAENPNVVSFKEVIDEDQTRVDYYQTQYNILQSRALARKTLDALDLWNTPPFGGKQPASGFSVGGAVAGVAGFTKGLFGGGSASSSGDGAAGDETATQSRAIDTFLSHLTVSPVRNSRLVDVKYDLPDPGLATRIINAFGHGYIDQNLEYKFTASKEAGDWLAKQLTEQRKQVEAANLALQNYREHNDAISLDDRQNIVVQKLTELNAAVTRAKTDRLEKQAAYEQLKASQANPASLDSFPAILTNAFVQQQKAVLAQLNGQLSELSDKFGDRHPQVTAVKASIQVAQAKLNGEIEKVVQSVKSEYQSALAQEQSLTAALDQQKTEALAMNRKGMEYGVLQRDAQSSQQIYDALMQRAKETGVSEELKTSNIRIVDAAERPRKPVSPNKPLDMLSAIFGGGLLAVGLAFFFEYLDSRIKTPDEIKHHLGLPHLGLLPLIAGDGSPDYALLTRAVPANFSEAFRVIRTNVLFSTAESGGQSILVTSTGPGEGKSLVASNLAVSLAQAGHRVLIIDADMRKPKVHQVFDVAQEPGLSNLLVGNVKASEAVRKSSVSGLWLLTAGRVPPNPAELLGSQRFKDFLLSLKQHFDWVVVDSPPVMAVADASVIAHAATGVLFVIGAEMTSRHAARRAVEQLESAQGKFFGAVLNRVDLEHNAYYYSQYYRREYATYYSSVS